MGRSSQSQVCLGCKASQKAHRELAPTAASSVSGAAPAPPPPPSTTADANPTPVLNPGLLLALAAAPAEFVQLQFLLNAKFVETEWFLHAALGRGVDFLDRDLSAGGARPAGARRAALDFRTTEVTAELGYQEVGHIRAIWQAVGGFPRPAIDLSADRFAMVLDDAMGARLDPPFDPYNSTVKF
ncbi:desiccation-related protein PCC13-62-like [Panicum miliaceum]|uniref:Desiccation-related protein PCC13-62-like n=1 Tax=Panicum miliaceum TaxID=4540 RepID=A0A3L6RZY2_PANMI|nr:desiccation-related protein PCC13-62-like [Panicum miliaceum]